MSEISKKMILVNLVSAEVFELFRDSDTFQEAVATLKSKYLRQHNVVSARHLLTLRKQTPTETISDYVQALKSLSLNGQFQEVDAVTHRNEAIRGSFIAGLSSSSIRQRLLESERTDLDSMIKLACSLELASQNANTYMGADISVQHESGDLGASTHDSACNKFVKPMVCHVDNHAHSIASTSAKFGQLVNEAPADYANYMQKGPSSSKKNCGYCGYGYHPRQVCPAREALCYKCHTKGHFAKVCRKSRNNLYLPDQSKCCYINPCESSLKKSMIIITINDLPIKALIDTGSTNNYMNPSIANLCGLKIYRTSQDQTVVMASDNCHMSVSGYCDSTITLHDQSYNNVHFGIMDNLCVDAILGLDFLNRHQGLHMSLNGNLPTLFLDNLCVVAACNTSSTTLNIDPPSIFTNLSSEVKPVACKSRKYSQIDKKFIADTIEDWLKLGKIEPSRSPWRAQPLVVGGDRHRKRLVIDFSQTINKFTLPDAYPLPRIDNLTDDLAKYKVFSTFDLKSAYLQIPLKENEKQFTAFEADGELYQFTHMPFGVTNGSATFQREMNKFINTNCLKGVYAYMDNLHVCGFNQSDHDLNLAAFSKAAKEINLTLNPTKSVLSTNKLTTLGYIIENGSKRPDPERLQPLLNMPVPNTPKALQRSVGLFSYYAHWIKCFSDKIAPLLGNQSFPLTRKAVDAFQNLRSEIAESVVTSIDESAPFELETDSSDIAISAVLNQHNRPVAFFSRMLNATEKRHSSIEKEACAIIESVRYWRHYLCNRRFVIKTDQDSVKFMFQKNHKNKIKNDKIHRWRLELSCYHFDIVHKPGKDNVVPDTLTRMFCSQISCNVSPSLDLHEIHDALCHPGITRLNAYVKCKNLPFSINDVRKVVNSCSICAELKPRFYRPPKNVLIKATKPFERLSIDFKGPLSSATKNKFMLTIIDEYSRFPFVYPCCSVDATTVIDCLSNLFSLFGLPSYIHSDRGSAFMSEKLQSYLLSLGVATSRTTPYNPRGNSQCERFNGIIWKSVMLALRSKRLPVEHWEKVISTALHSIRSLISTSTNETPHERMFNFARKASNGNALPSWLSNPGPVYLRKFVRNSKFSPTVEKVELLQANPQYAYVQFPNGRESTVSLKDLAPCGESAVIDSDSDSIVSDTFDCESASANSSVPIPIDSSNTLSDDIRNSPVSPKGYNCVNENQDCNVSHELNDIRDCNTTNPNQEIVRTKSGRVVKPPIRFTS